MKEPSQDLQQLHQHKIIEITQGHLPCLIYLVPQNNIIFQEIVQKLRGQIIDIFGKATIDLIDDPELHVSLSDVFRLPINQRSIFMALFKKQISKPLSNNIPIPLLFRKVSVLQSKYIVLQLHEISSKKIQQNILPKINAFMIKRGYLPYCHKIIEQQKTKECENSPSHSPIVWHITLAKINDHLSPPTLISHLTKLSNIKVSPHSFSLNQLVLKLGNKGYQMMKP